MRIAFALEQMWVTVDPAEGISWFERLLEAPALNRHRQTIGRRLCGPTVARCTFRGRPDLAERVSLRSLAIFEEHDDEHGQAVMLHRLAITR